MTRAELIRRIAKASGQPQAKVSTFLEGFEEVIGEIAKEGETAPLKIGKFYSKEMPARSYPNLFNPGGPPTYKPKRRVLAFKKK